MFDFSTKAHRKEAWAFLETMWEGLEYLCHQVEQEERERAAKLGKNVAYIDFGNQPGDAMVCNYSFGMRARFTISYSSSKRHSRLLRTWRASLARFSDGDTK
jgi:hypothetical protein